MLITARSSEILAPKIFKTDDDEFVRNVGSGKVNKMVVDSSKSKKSKNEKSKNLTYIGALKEPTFLTSDAKEAFNRL